MKRREFFKTAARAAILTAVGAGAFFGLRTNKINATASGACPVNPSCSGCREYAECSREIKKAQPSMDGN